MKDKITAFAALKTFYESGHDLLGVFGNLILLVVSANNLSSISKIQQALMEEINYEVPEDVLRTVLKRLKKDGFVEYTNIKNADFVSIKLTEIGENQEKKVRENYESAKREKQSILESMRSNRHLLPYSDLQLIKELDIFIENSTNHAVDILDGTSLLTEIGYTKEQQNVATFFSDAEKSNPNIFERLKTFLYGQIISKAFLSRQFDAAAKIEKLSIYLDTNVVFSLMGFHEDCDNIPTKEIINLIKECGISLKVFSFTVMELKKTLSAYLVDFGYYSSEIKVRSIFQVLKRKNVSKIDVISLLENLEERLSNLEIEVDYSFEVELLTNNQQEKLSKLGVYKTQSKPASIKHDLAALLGTMKLRTNKAKYQWEKSEAIFLTADRHLAQYDFIEHEHREQHTFPEVIFRSDLASLLWLKGKSGSDNVFLHNLFAIHMREKIISANLWGKFVNELKEKRKQGDLSQDDIDRIISLSETEILLRDKKEAGIDELLDDNRIQQIRKEILDKEKASIENESIIISQSEQIINISLKIEERCKIFWSRVINLFVFIVTLIFIILIIISLTIWGISLVANIIQVLTLIVILVAAYSVIKKEKFEPLGFLINYRLDIENRLVIKSIRRNKEKLGLFEEKK